MTSQQTQPGVYVNFSLNEQGNLLLTPTAALTEDAADMSENESDFYSLIEDHLSNGWDTVRPEEIGALVGDTCPILTNTGVWDDSGNLTECDTVYAFTDYAVTNESESLLAGQTLLFMRY